MESPPHAAVLRGQPRRRREDRGWRQAFDVMRAGLLGEATRVRDFGVSAEAPSDLAHALLVDTQGLMVMSRLGLSLHELRARTRVVFTSRFGAAFKPRAG
jgi:hypothetical protein